LRSKTYFQLQTFENFDLSMLNNSQASTVTAGVTQGDMSSEGARSGFGADTMFYNPMASELSGGSGFV
jgi:hypothetical protein